MLRRTMTRRAHGSKAEALSAAGLLIGSIYAGANTVATFFCGGQDSAHGTTDGEDAVGVALALGQPVGSAINLDLYANQASPQST